VGIARFKFHEGSVEEFKRLSAQALEIVRTKDTGTLQYDISTSTTISPSASSSSGTGTPRHSSSTLSTLAI
jgi:quinol monooxygenase YgiN